MGLINENVFRFTLELNNSHHAVRNAQEGHMRCVQTAIPLHDQQETELSQVWTLLRNKIISKSG